MRKGHTLRVEPWDADSDSSLWWRADPRARRWKQRRRAYLQTKPKCLASFPISAVMTSICIDACLCSPWDRREIEINCPLITIADAKLGKYQQASVYFVFYLSEQTNGLGCPNTPFPAPSFPPKLVSPSNRNSSTARVSGTQLSYLGRGVTLLGCTIWFCTLAPEIYFNSV